MSDAGQESFILLDAKAYSLPRNIATPAQYEERTGGVEICMLTPLAQRRETIIESVLSISWIVIRDAAIGLGM